MRPVEDCDPLGCENVTGYIKHAKKYQKHGRFSYLTSGLDKKHLYSVCRLAHIWHWQHESIIVIEELAAVPMRLVFGV